MNESLKINPKLLLQFLFDHVCLEEVFHLVSFRVRVSFIPLLKDCLDLTYEEKLEYILEPLYDKVPNRKS